MCLEKFYENTREFDCFNVKIIMPDMANNFFIACRSIFGEELIHLWCAHHFYKAFNLKLIVKVKNIQNRKEIDRLFYILVAILDQKEFNKELKIFM